MAAFGRGFNQPQALVTAYKQQSICQGHCDTCTVARFTPDHLTRCQIQAGQIEHRLARDLLISSSNFSGEPVQISVVMPELMDRTVRFQILLPVNLRWCFRGLSVQGDKACPIVVRNVEDLAIENKWRRDRCATRIGASHREFPDFASVTNTQSLQFTIGRNHGTWFACKFCNGRSLTFAHSRGPAMWFSKCPDHVPRQRIQRLKDDVKSRCFTIGVDSATRITGTIAVPQQQLSVGDHR